MLQLYLKLLRRNKDGYIKTNCKFFRKIYEKWDYQKAIKLSDNEAKTRDYLIEPVFNMLGYNKMDHYSHEYSLKYGAGKVKKVDMVITLRGKILLC